MINIYCDNKHRMTPVHNTGENKVICVGFYCAVCKQFTVSIGRERKVPIPF